MGLEQNLDVLREQIDIRPDALQDVLHTYNVIQAETRGDIATAVYLSERKAWCKRYFEEPEEFDSCYQMVRVYMFEKHLIKSRDPVNTFCDGDMVD